jgi:membrane protein DedA with SNARE-associated domain
MAGRGMDQFVDQIRSFIETNQDWAGPVTALLTMAESLVIIGLFVPATALMLIMGGLIGGGSLDGSTILAWGMAGAVVGDALSYWLGRGVGPRVLRRWPLRNHRTAVARARLFFSRYGFASVLAGRFMGPIRSTIPTVAGVMGMSHTRFQAANVLSAALWMPAMLAPGYLTMRNMDDISEFSHIGMLVATGISVLLGIWLLCMILRKRRVPAAARRARR